MSLPGLSPLSRRASCRSAKASRQSRKAPYAADEAASHAGCRPHTTGGRIPSEWGEWAPLPTCLRLPYKGRLTCRGWEAPWGATTDQGPPAGPWLDRQRPGEGDMGAEGGAGKRRERRGEGRRRENETYGKGMETNAKEPRLISETGLLTLEKMAASYSPALHCSTIGAGGLNFSVRNGKRWDPAAIAT